VVYLRHNLEISRVIRSSRMRRGACSTHRMDEKCIQFFGKETRREEIMRNTYAWV
jgi:hypothetical protein